MPDSPRPRPTPAQLLYGKDGPVRGPDNREAPKADWIEALRWRIGPEWTAGGPWDRQRWWPCRTRVGRCSPSRQSGS
jgi:hypothetical protein